MFYKASGDSTKLLHIDFEGDSEMGIDGEGPRKKLSRKKTYGKTSFSKIW